VPTAVSAKAIYYLTCEDTSYLTTEAEEHIILDDSVSTMKVISKWGGTSKTAQNWATYNTRITESGDTRITEDGNVRMIEEAQYTPKPNTEWTEN